MGISHEAVELRSPLAGTTDAFIDVLSYDLPASASTILPKFGELHFRVLSVERRDACVQSDPHAAPAVTP
jgi:hypothetical protein